MGGISRRRLVLLVAIAAVLAASSARGAGSASTLVLTVAVTGNGSVTGGGISCGVGGSICKQNIASGTSVTLTAKPVGGATFSGWSGACTGTSTTCTFSMTAAQNVSAAFSGGQSFSLTVGVTGNGTVTGGGIGCGGTLAACTVNEAPSASVTLIATPALGSTFTGWSGACTGSTSTCKVTMTAAKSVQAAFSAAPSASTVTLTVTISGRGTVTAPAGTCSSGGSSAACTQPYSAGSSIKLGATPAPGARFNGWGGACSGKGDCTLTMSSSKSVTAHFTGGPATAGLALRSLGPPVVRAIGSSFLVTVRFRTTQPGNAQLRLLRSGRRVTSISLTARAGAVRFGPFLVRNGGSYALVLVFTDLSGRTKTLRWSTCLGQCANPAPTGGLQLTRGEATVLRKGAVASVTLHFTTSEQVTVLVDVLRNGKPVLKRLRFSFAAGPVALGPFAINRSGSYSFRLDAADSRGRHASLRWVVAVATG